MYKKATPMVLAALLYAFAFPAAGSADAGLSIHYTLCPWSMTVTDPDGRVLLRTPGDEHTDGDPLRRYGRLGFTTNRRRPDKEVFISDSYNFYRGDDSPWTQAGCAVSSSTGGSTSAFILDTEDSRGRGISVTVEVISPRVFRFRAFLTPAGDVNRFAQSFHLPDDDHFFGFGERFNKLDQRGESVFCEVEDGGLGLGPDAPPGPGNPWPNGPLQTYWPIPFFFSPRGYGILLTTSQRSVFELGTHFTDAWRMETWEPAMEYYFFYGPDPLDIIDQYTAVAGRPPAPIPWVFAPWNDAVKGEASVDARARDLRENGIPSSAIWTEDLMWGAGGYDVDRTLYPAAEDMIARLHAMGFKFLGYHSPWVDAETPDFITGTTNGYFITTAAGLVYPTASGRLGDTSLPDFTNPQAAAWYQSLLKRGIDLGLDGWMHDFGEFTPYDCWFTGSTPGWAMRNTYPVLYQKAARDLLVSLGKEADITFFARSGYTGSQRLLTSAWSGDQNTDWEPIDGLPGEIPAGLTLGMSGMPYWGSDIAGYDWIVNPPATKELFIRWVEFGAVSPIMRTHHGLYNFPADRQWSYNRDPETLAIYRAYATLHQSLFPYIFTYAHRAHQTGAPIMRALVLQYPDDPRTYPLADQFLLGEDLLAAPVLADGARERRLYLPRGRWVDYWTGWEYEGGRDITVPAPLDTLPLFVRAGAILPLLDESVMTMAPATDPAIVTYEAKKHILRLSVYTAGDSRFTLYDGTTIQVHGASDGYPQFPPGVESAVHGLLPYASGDAIRATCMNCWWFDRAAGRLLVRIQAQDDTITTQDGAVLSVSGSPMSRDISITMDYLPRKKEGMMGGCGCSQAGGGGISAAGMAALGLFCLAGFLRRTGLPVRPSIGRPPLFP